MNDTTNVEIYRKHLERSLKLKAGVVLFGKSRMENYHDWQRYCLRTDNAEVIVEK
jgi:hypothetical protein